MCKRAGGVLEFTEKRCRIRLEIFHKTSDVSDTRRLNLPRDSFASDYISSSVKLQARRRSVECLYLAPSLPERIWKVVLAQGGESRQCLLLGSGKGRSIAKVKCLWGQQSERKADVTRQPGWTFIASALGS